ncbi:ABC transporter permease [Amycolatopsis sp. NBC_00345]|uniref:ABC transporter permease n=1 Tax=Amycolatopsis sp. NBC_00345 TaxID=2975955 RepID=UPI002E25D785
MSWADSPGRARALARVAWRDYLRQYPPSVILLALAPRVLTQVAFWTLLARAAGGPDSARYAMAGAIGQVVVSTMVGRASDVVLEDAVQGLSIPLRLGRTGPVTVVFARWLVYTPEAMLAGLLAVVVAPPLLGEPELLGPLLGRLPELLALALASACFGVFVASAAAFSGRAQTGVLAANAATYLTLVVCGVVAPLPDLPVLREIAAVLPMTHGIGALRSAAPGPELRAEAVTALAWLALAVVAIRARSRRAAGTGGDDDQF